MRLQNKEDKYKSEGKKIIDQESFDEYVKLSEDPLFAEVEHTSSTGRVINLLWLMDKVRIAVGDLGEEEREQILEKKKKIQGLITKLNTALKRAYEGDAVITNSRFRFLRSKKEALIDLFGRLFTLAEVRELALKEWGIDLSITILEEFRQSYIKDIQTKIQDFKSNISSLRLTHKRSRLEELSFLYFEEKTRYVESKNVLCHKQALAVLEQIRKEVEGDKLSISGELQLSIEKSINIHIKTEVFKNISLKEIIIGRVSSRLGLSPSLLINQLNNSYYSKFNTLSDSFKQKELDIPYPSELTYEVDLEAEEKAENPVVINNGTNPSSLRNKLLNLLSKNE